MVTGDVAGPGGQLEVRVQVVHHHVVLRGQVRHAVGVRHDLVCVADHTTHVSGHYSCTTSSTLEKEIKTFIVVFSCSIDFEHVCILLLNSLK